MKKLLAIALASVMVLGLAACGANAAAPAEEAAPAAEAAAPAEEAAPAAEAEEAAPAAEAAAPADNKTLVVGFSQYAAYNGWRIANTNSVQDAIKAEGWDCIYADANDDTAKQVSDLEDIIAQSPDYLVVAPREVDGYANVITEANEAGIPVIFYDRVVNGGDYMTFIHGDYIMEGEEVGKAVVEAMGTTDPVKVVELTGTPGADVTAQRAEGFRNIVEANSNYEIVASQVGNFSRTESQSAMENILQSVGGENIDVVYAHSDDNAIGAIQAIKAAGLTPGKDIMVFGVDGTLDGLKSIIDGEMTATYLCNPFYGPSVVDVIKKLEAGETVEKDIVNPGKLYNIDNAQKSIDEGEGF